jgi:hypothetical protein
LTRRRLAFPATGKAQTVPMIPELTDKIAEVLAACDAMGMQWPYIMIFANRNGSVLASRFHEDESVDELVYHMAPDVMFPVSGMILDQNDRVLNFVIDVAGVMKVIH